ncbi:peptidoglycan bridge formation glycyltransferase FemA/FemB family protein [Erysipelotrichaceae bacterium HCN-30851]
MSYQFSDYIQKEEHDSFVKGHPLCNLLQSSSWGSVKENWNNTIVGVYDDGKLVASSLVLIKPLPLHFTMMYIPRGPVMDYQNSALVSFFFKELKRFARKYHCLFITFDPAVHCNDYLLSEANENRYPQTVEIITLLESAGAIFKGFTKAIDDTIQPRYHANVYNDEMFETPSKTLKKALLTVKKKMIQVVPYHVEAVDDFSAVMHCTEERKQIHLRDADYFNRIMNVYGDDAVIFLAKLPLKKLYEDTVKLLKENENNLLKCPENAKKKRFTLEELHVSLTREEKELREYMQTDGDEAIISGALCVSFGNTAEILYAGMDERYKRYMAPYASFYNCMIWSFKKGCTSCNMGGIEGSLKGGLTQFKSNFKPVINEYIGEFDLPVYKSLYRLSQYAYKIRKSYFKKKA